jgi:hypothetical protein
MLCLLLVERCGCFPCSGELSDASRRLGIYMKTARMKIFYFSATERRRNLGRFSEKYVGCRLDSSEK